MSIDNADSLSRDPIVNEAIKQFRRCVQWEQHTRNLQLEDLKFAEADSDNMYQWPNSIRRNRDMDERPCLTVNRTRQHNLQIINDAKQNKPAIVIRPTGNGATYESAQTYSAIMRHIEYQSDATSAYGTATGFQVKMGIGWLRVVRDYAGDDGFDQEIFIRRVPDPFAIYCDPDAKEADKSDMKFAFVFDDVLKDDFDEMYPEYKGMGAQRALGSEMASGFITDDHIRVCEYFRKVENKDQILAITDPHDGKLKTVRKSQLPKELWQEIDDDPQTLKRSIFDTKVERYLIIGERIAEKTKEPGRYIPLVPVIGEETVIDGQMDRKGHTRAMKDPQRIYNYWTPLALNTFLPTPTGWTTMGDVREGDWLFDENGKPVQVAGTSPIHLHRKCLRIEFDDGSHIIADAEHGWTVEERGPYQSWVKKTVTTAQLTPKKHFIYATKSLDLPDIKLPIHPYLLGVWLGNGNTDSPQICCGTIDVDKMKSNLQECGYRIGEPRIYNNRTSAMLTIHDERDTFRSLGLLGNKHIPNIYLRASHKQREQLLQGLMDTDGSFVEGIRQCSFSTSHDIIADGFSELLRTLGIKSVFCERAAKSAIFPNGETYTRLPHKQFSFSVGPEVKVFKLNRKSCLQQEPRTLHTRRTKRYRIKSVQEVPSVPVKCVTINSASHLFLAGPGMVPTHNSSAVENVALQGKTPWIAPAASIEDYEGYWNTANKVNHSVLPYNAYDDAGNQLPPPSRPEPPTMAPAYISGMQIAVNEMMMVSGQYQPQMGEPSNERSGKALAERQRQGDNATYHFIDNLGTAIRCLGKILLDLVPRVYDTKRVMQVLAVDGTDFELEIDPQARQSFEQHLNHDQEIVRRIFNPSVGKYDVQADIGPAYGTQRQQMFDALTTLLAQAPNLSNILGDIWMRAADFPGADEAALRFKRMLPPQALGQGPTQAETALQGQVQSLTQLLQKAIDDLAMEKLKLKGKESMREIDAFEADTHRLKVVGDHALSKEELKVLVAQLMHEITNNTLDRVVQANEPSEPETTQ